MQTPQIMFFFCPFFPGALVNVDQPLLRGSNRLVASITDNTANHILNGRLPMFSALSTIAPRAFSFRELAFGLSRRFLRRDGLPLLELLASRVILLDEFFLVWQLKHSQSVGMVNPYLVKSVRGRKSLIYLIVNLNERVWADSISPTYNRRGRKLSLVIVLFLDHRELLVALFFLPDCICFC